MAKATKELINTPGIDVQFLIDAEDSGGSATAFVARVGPGAQTPPAHLHADWDETVYCTQGTMTYTVDGEKLDLEQGQALCVRRGQVHKFDNLTDADAWMLVVSTPGLFEEDYFLSIAEILNAASDGPPDVVALLAVQARHGVTVAPR
ncbi:MAG TPA: cupin domain-containing protein [Acidimicrobiales bacterium]|nr:cupin domain-containing protein [Acidimicrobiales bacterium]